MPNSGKRVDPIPDEFATYEDAAAFWDTHDTTTSKRLRCANDGMRWKSTRTLYACCKSKLGNGLSLSAA
jgi:hypothetical protein